MSMVGRSIPFHLISSAVQMGSCGWSETMSRIKVCPIIRLNAWTKFRCLSREWEDTAQCLNWKTKTGSYGSVEPIILRVRKTPNAYTVMYHTFDDEFYFLKGGTEEYDRVLVYRTAYFIANWAMMNSRDVIVETPSVQELIWNKMKELEGLYQTNE